MSDRDGPRSVDHSTSWEHTSSWHTNGGAFSDIDHSPSGRRTGLPLDGMQSLSISSSGSPQRASFDSAARPSMSRWRDSIQVEAERRGMSPTTMDTPTLIEPTFDENVLRALCDLDCGVPLLLDRIKQSAISCREAANFFKRRATIEGDYGRDLLKLARSSTETYSMNEGKAGTFVDAWHAAMKIHESVAENRIRFSQRLNEMSEELTTLSKEVDKNRKQTKELATRYERALQESETATEKSKNRFDVTAEELERVLLAKEGESSNTGVQNRSQGGATSKRVLGKAMNKGGLLLKGKNPGNIQRQEDDIRMRMSAASDVYRKAVTDTQTMRQEYFNFQLPRILRALKECADEIDLGTQYHLTRYAFLFESVILGDGSTLAPATEDSAPGLKPTFESIDNRADFRVFMQNYAYAHGGSIRGPRREGPPEAGFLPPLPSHVDKMRPSAPGLTSPSMSSGAVNPMAIHRGDPGTPDRGRPTFGIDLTEQMTRDNVEVPPIVEKCCEAIERLGLQSQGLYRLSGTQHKVLKLKEKLDRDMDSVDLDSPEWSGDINNITSVLKLWLRELPDPLLTGYLHPKFLEAAKNEENRLRQIRLHEQVNELPDANYATLRYLLGHLHKVAQFSAHNSMSIQNLAIVFGPTLFGAYPADGSNGMADTNLQNKAVETILEHYLDIFVDDADTTD